MFRVVVWRKMVDSDATHYNEVTVRPCPFCVFSVTVSTGAQKEVPLLFLLRFPLNQSPIAREHPLMKDTLLFSGSGST